MLCQVKSVKPMKNLSQGRGRRFLLREID